jgi:hypothetical protein
VRTEQQSRSRSRLRQIASTTMISHPKIYARASEFLLYRFFLSFPVSPSLQSFTLFHPHIPFFLHSFLREIMPHGPFRHGRRQGLPNELSRLFGLDTSTDPTVQPTTAIVDSPVAVSVSATSANTPVSPTSQAQPCTYLCLLRIHNNLAPFKPPQLHRLL